MNKVLFLPIIALLVSSGFIMESVFAQQTNTMVANMQKARFEGEGQMPLGPGNVQVLNRVTLETQDTPPSEGQSTYHLPTTPDDVVDGQRFTVDRFFEVFPEITIQDIDEILSNDGRLATIITTQLGKRAITSMHHCVADTSKPNFGCLEQLDSIVIEGFEIELNVDINEDGTDDKITVPETLMSIIPPALSVDITGPDDVITNIQYTVVLQGQAPLSGTVNPPFSIPMSGTITISEEIFYPPIGGEIIPVESVSLILAGAQSFSWMIPVVFSILGIGLVLVKRTRF